MNEEVFKEKYSKLNLRQKEAVDSIEGPVMVIAGPGTGKTSILTLRIANILKQTDTPPDGILALTFTESGVRAMRAKLREIIGSRADDVRIHTFHSFASSVINEFDDHFPHLAKAKQMTEIEAEELVKKILQETKFSKLRPLGDPDHYVSKILRTIQECKKEAWTADMMESFARSEIERIKNDQNSISSRGVTKGQLKADALTRIEKCEKTVLFARVYSLYEERKKQEKRMDYDDLIIEVLVALKNDELLLRTLQEKFLYILVDEHQDTNDAQNLLVKNLADFFEEPNLFVVGDEKQAIYRFQGASVENFLRFQDIWKSMRVIRLEDNYRSHQALLDATFSLIEKNYKEDEHENLRVRLRSGNGLDSKKIEIVRAGNTAAANKYLVEEIQEILKQSDDEVAVIVRTNREVGNLMSLFDEEGLEASAERGADIFSHPIGRLFFEILEFLNDPTRLDSLSYTIAGGLWNLNFSNSIDLLKKIKSGRFEDVKLVQLDEIQQSLAQESPVSFVINLAQISGLIDVVVKSPLSSEIWRGIVSLAQDLSAKNNIDDPKVLIQEMLSYRSYAETKTVKIFSGSDKAKVRIMTAHASKGLEFDYVFIPNALEETWLTKSRSSSFVLPRENEDVHGINDTRRLFYVALTRARKHAVIISPLEDEMGKILSPVRFIEELDQANITWKDVEAVHLPMERKKVDLDTKNRKEILEYTRHILIEKGLSVTALNHFFNCPAEFVYKSILKIPEAPSATSEKGTAMHDAISEVWKVRVTDLENIQEVMKCAIQKYFENSQISRLEREAVLTELMDAIPHVSSELLEHFNQDGEVSTEAWKEIPLEIKIGKETVTLRLHGKLDSLIEKNDRVSVYDYKTRSKMSLAEIKGETKESDGNYFRQLVFYKLLLSENPKYKGKVSETSLVFVKPDNKGKCHFATLDITKEDIGLLKSEIERFVEKVWSGDLLSGKCADKECPWCALSSLL